MQKSTRNTMVATKMPLEAKKGPKNAKYWSKNPDEKIYLDFGDQNFKIDQKSFSPGSQPPERDFSKKWGKQIQKHQKNPKNENIEIFEKFWGHPGVVLG